MITTIFFCKLFVLLCFILFGYQRLRFGLVCMCAFRVSKHKT
uniref:Uncharacterized protein n=1 Tax=Anguilla anguilla TaxID=7936 RepID=A0A0E9Q3X5_ANGAN